MYEIEKYCMKRWAHLAFIQQVINPYIAPKNACYRAFY